MDSTTDQGTSLTIGSPLGLLGYVFFAIGLWAMLRKAGIPGWGAIIPIYNIYLYIKLGGLSGILIFLLIIPIVNIFAAFYIAGYVARAYGHGWLMAIVGLVLFAPIGVLVLGFDRSGYRLPRFDRPVSNNGA